MLEEHFLNRLNYTDKTEKISLATDCLIESLRHSQDALILAAKWVESARFANYEAELNKDEMIALQERIEERAKQVETVAESLKGHRYSDNQFLAESAALYHIPELEFSKLLHETDDIVNMVSEGYHPRYMNDFDEIHNRFEQATAWNDRANAVLANNTNQSTTIHVKRDFDRISQKILMDMNHHVPRQKAFCELMIESADDVSEALYLDSDEVRQGYINDSEHLKDVNFLKRLSEFKDKANHALTLNEMETLKTQFKNFILHEKEPLTAMQFDAATIAQEIPNGISPSKFKQFSDKTLDLIGSIEENLIELEGGYKNKPKVLGRG